MAVKVEVRTTHGVTRLRAGLGFSPSWSTHEVTEEQLAALRADKVLEIRTPQAQVEAQAARTEEAEGEALGLRAQLDNALQELAQAQARIAELEGEVEHFRKAHEETLQELETLTAPPAPAPPAPTPTAPQS